MDHIDNLNHGNASGQNIPGSKVNDPNLEQQNRTGTNTDDSNANTPARVLTATSIIGDNVKNTKGEDLGEIKDIMINLQSGGIDYIVLQFGDFLGIGGKLFAIPFKAFRLDEQREIFILDKDKEFFKDAPGFDKDHWPKTNSEHLQNVYAYWGGGVAGTFPPYNMRF